MVEGWKGEGVLVRAKPPIISIAPQMPKGVDPPLGPAAEVHAERGVSAAPVPAAAAVPGASRCYRLGPKKPRALNRTRKLLQAVSPSTAGTPKPQVLNPKP